MPENREFYHTRPKCVSRLNLLILHVGQLVNNRATLTERLQWTLFETRYTFQTRIFNLCSDCFTMHTRVVRFVWLTPKRVILVQASANLRRHIIWIITFPEQLTKTANSWGNYIKAYQVNRPSKMFIALAVLATLTIRRVRNGVSLSPVENLSCTQIWLRMSDADKRMQPYKKGISRVR